ncbi:MAG: pyridoxine 5'-phosphate synthase [Candidatus Cloacimonetes bacterium]|nr:pyridoxine 5'-phosphate synthase [Candidatus Cloacimonadota bacterium]MBS3767154.1 pyridoxine 5'-phosphate synthase [Candidatus Cloacimonadota bacterium]
MRKLGVNIDHVATIREARKTFEPDPIEAAYIAEKHGADQITTHLREDRRHIQDRDLRLLRETVQTRLNLEMAPTEEMIAIAKSIHPDEVTLVPEKREEVTTEGGLKVDLEGLEDVISRLKSEDIFVSLFIDPDNETIKKSKKMGVDAVELHTGYFANATENNRDKEVDRIQDAAAYAKKQGLYVVAGHGITYYNVKYLNKIEEIVEYNIGHSIVSRAVFAGLGEAVRLMKQLIVSR